jgi:HD-like signal output (HDOD) protein
LSAHKPQRRSAPASATAFDIEEEVLTKSDVQERDIVVHVKAQIRSATQHNAPMLPESAQRALTVAGDPEVSIRALVEIVEPDPVTTARVLAISNGPLYAPAKRIASLKSAIMLLGVGLVRDVLYQSVAEAHIFRGASAKMLARQRLHGVAVGYRMRDLSGHLGLNRDFAFLAGLLHDVGTIVLQQMLDTSPPVTYDPSQYDVVMESLHSEVGHFVAQRWELPPAVAEVANRHHDYQGAGRDGYSQLGHVAAAAERLAEHVGLSEDGTCRPLTPDDMSMFYQLGLNEVAIDLAIHEAEKVQEHVRALG